MRVVAILAHGAIVVAFLVAVSVPFCALAALGYYTSTR